MMFIMSDLMAFEVLIVTTASLQGTVKLVIEFEGQAKHLGQTSTVREII